MKRIVKVRVVNEKDYVVGDAVDDADACRQAEELALADLESHWLGLGKLEVIGISYLDEDSA